MNIVNEIKHAITYGQWLSTGKITTEENKLLMEKITPSLIENSTKFYLRSALKESRNIKNKYINIGVNIFLFILFINLLNIY